MEREIQSTTWHPPLKEKETNEIEYPFGYFDAQVQFAIKWADITGDELADVLLNQTALYRRVIGIKPNSENLDNENWVEVIEGKDSQEIAQALYDIYLTKDHAQYEALSYPENDGKHFGFFSFDYYPNNKLSDGKNTIKVHFINSKRGEKSGLHSDFLEQRKDNLLEMFTFIKENFLDADEVIGGSWLYHVPGYKDSFPLEFIKTAKKMVPKGYEHIENSVANMSFQGNSLWGQFINRYGNIRISAYDQFLKKLDSAETVEDLLAAFPERPLQPKLDIKSFYNGLGI